MHNMHILCIIMHILNFLGFFWYSLDQYLPPPKRIRILSALVFGPGLYTPHTTLTDTTHLQIIGRDAPLTPGEKSTQKYWFLGELWPSNGQFRHPRPSNGQFRHPRRISAIAFWAATAKLLVLDPSNPIWDESGWWEEQFGAPFAPLGPSGGNDYFTPNFWAGRGSETFGRWGPGISPKVSRIIRGTCGAQSSNLELQKICLGPPPPPPPPP